MAILTYVVWLAVNIVVVKGCSEGCAPKPSGPGPLVAPRNDSDIVREGHPKRFLCCGKGFVRISWSFQTNGSHTWTDVTPLAGKIQVCNDGQVLQILAVAVKEEGLYQCTLSNGTAARSAYHRLRVVACSSMSQPPQVMVAPHNATARVGDSVTFSCKAFFGCGDPIFKNVRWFSVVHHDRKMEAEMFWPGHHYNYIYDMYNTSNLDIIGADLKIDPVMIGNFSQTYLCYVGRIKLSAAILHPDITIKLTVMEIVLFAGGAVATVILVVFTALCCWLHFPQISFWCNTKCNMFPRKGEFLYDTAVVCTEQDVREVRVGLLQTLRENLGYRVYFAPDDLSGGRNETTGQTDMFPKTYCAIMYISEQSLEENAFKFICHCATCLIGGPYLILVKKGNIPKMAWQQVPRNLERKLKVILTLTLPYNENGRSNGEDVQRFWNSIQSKLPKPQIKVANVDAPDTGHGINNNEPLTSSHVPLLSDR